MLGPPVPRSPRNPGRRPGITGGPGTCAGAPVRRWPAPVVDAILEPLAAQTAAVAGRPGVIARSGRCSGPTAWRCQPELGPAGARGGGACSCRTRYQAERRQLAVARRALFVAAPTRRNRVWQTDFTEYETSRGGHLAGESRSSTTRRRSASPRRSPGTTAARDAISRHRGGHRRTAERLLGSCAPRGLPRSGGPGSWCRSRS